MHPILKNTRILIKNARNGLDKILRAGVRLFMLAGVTFTFSACYGPPPERYYGDEPEFQADTQKIEQQLNTDNNLY